MRERGLEIDRYMERGVNQPRERERCRERGEGNQPREIERGRDRGMAVAALSRQPHRLADCLKCLLTNIITRVLVLEYET